jgi:hypothetical protein
MGQNHYTKAANKALENVIKFKYLRMMVTKIVFMKKLRAD